MNGEQKPAKFAKAPTSKASTTNKRARNEKKSVKKQKQSKQRQLQGPTPMPVLHVDTEEKVQCLDVSCKLEQNGLMESATNTSIGLENDTATTMRTTTNNATINTEESTDQPENLLLPLCNMCNRHDDVCVNNFNNYELVSNVSEFTRLPSWNIKEVVSSLCSRCLVYINALSESSAKLRMRFQQAMHNQTLVLAPPTPDTSPATPLLEDIPAHHANNLQQRNCYAPGYCEDSIVNDLPNLSRPPTPTVFLQNRAFEHISRSPSPNNGGNNSMLKIHHERPVSPLNTESGGGKNNKRSYQRIKSIPVQLVCAHCNRAYWRKDFYAKHMRRCGAKNRYAKSMTGGTVNRSRSRLDFLETVSVVSERHDDCTPPTVQKPPRVFRCNKCSVTVESLAKLREHKKIHVQRFYCNICSRELSTSNEYDFHYAECSAKSEVYEKGIADLRNNKVNSPPPARRKTRSFSRACSVAPPSLAPSRAGSSKSNKTTSAQKATKDKKGLSKKQTRQQTKTKAKQQKEQEQQEQTQQKEQPQKQKQEQAQQQQQEQEKPQQKQKHDDSHSTITNFVKHHSELYTDIDNVESIASEKEVEENDDEGEDDDEDDAVSQVDTLYSKRLSLTNHWVEEHSHSSHSHLSQDDNYLDDYIDDIPFKSIKEYDLYLLDRLEVEVKQCSLTCFAPNCSFTTTTLTDMMIHDYLFHFKKAWYYCHKCGHCFTSKVFLDYHLYLQNKGRYVCHKCGGPFEYQHELDRHFIQHNRQSENSSERYICHYCNYEFLDEDKLLKHCDEENHSWNSERTVIKIDHSMTIVNKVPPQYAQTRRNNKYKVRILNMALKRMPSKRCIPIERYRPYLPLHLQNPYIQHRIGRVEFLEPTNPNCVGCL